MIFAILRRNDGLPAGRIWLGSVVKNLQSALVEARQPVSVDGHFGSGTENAVKAFQAEQGLDASGIVDKPTWTALDGLLQPSVGSRQRELKSFLNDFEGDLEWVHEQEGHRGTAYWPGGKSGVTLDPGVDLGHIDWTVAERFYADLFTGDQAIAVRRVLGLKGKDAEAALNADPILRSIRISNKNAERIMPLAAQSYWKRIAARFSSLTTETLPSVQTVFLSLAYNRGSDNDDLDQLHGPLESHDWSALADTVGAMQQTHEAPGIPIRRRAEASLIRAELEYVNS
jgi:peptidoglycan hydrolase-like protein with peptidoglycan-binding domain